ncbi:hypothetical protein ACQ4M3_02360 [Leptolyngbya sp. AN03gr2]|uniref:hypothetical protein n=1 Tax=unclassified Leptolyngbya TaxID=2650499 RepID=UPI003D320C64
MRVSFSLAVASFLGLVLIQPARAIDCDPMAIGMEADNCRSKIAFNTNTNAPGSIEQYKLSLSTQLPIAIARYNQTATAMIAQRQVKPTIVVSQSSLENLPVVALSLDNVQAPIALSSRLQP